MKGKKKVSRETFENSCRIGERIRKIRKQKKISMKDLAKQVGVSFSYIAKIETGQNRLNVDMLHKIAEVLRVSVVSLLEPEKVEEKTLREKGWYLLKDFFVVHYDAQGRPEKAYYNIQDREANLIGQLREVEGKAPELAEEIYKTFEQFAETKDLRVFEKWYPAFFQKKRKKRG